MIKLYGHPASTCTRKVLMTLAETSTPFEIHTVDLTTGEQKKEAHLRRQPFGHVPAIDDDGFELFESRAIARYLAEKATSPLVPRDLKVRALMDQWISIETSEFTPHAMKFIYHEVFKRPQEPAVLDAASTALTNALVVMGRQLAKTPFFAGAAFTLADIGFMPYFEYAMMTPAKGLFEKHAHVMTWWNQVSARPAWHKAIGR